MNKEVVGLHIRALQDKTFEDEKHLRPPSSDRRKRNSNLLSMQ